MTKTNESNERVSMIHNSKIAIKGSAAANLFEFMVKYITKIDNIEEIEGMAESCTAFVVLARNADAVDDENADKIKETFAHVLTGRHIELLGVGKMESTFGKIGG